MKETIEKINERVALAQQNPELPFTFYVNGSFNPQLTDAKSKKTDMGDILYPACSKLVYDDGGGLKQHILVFNGNDDIFNGEKINTNEKGKFEEPTLPRIKFTNGQKLVYGDSLANLNLIRYLSYMEFFTKSVKCRDVTTNPVQLTAVTTEDIVKYASLVDALSKTDEGFDLVKSIAKDSLLNPTHQTIEGISKMEGGKQKVVSIVKSYISNPSQFGRFVKQILPDDMVMKQTKEFLEKGIVGYNKATSSFQMKTGEGFSKDVIFTTKQESDVTRTMLFAHFLQRNSDWKVKLQNALDVANRK